ncbi:hypothetical protein [Thermogymnomonas acidicola]|uniref:NMD3-related protein n=1 Tax=Thermogymnomonas acidicola TaxID=399579 RepID=UPI0009468684|nr:NMD3-related protein [Thermogymnomonas acidicola]
MRELRCQGSGRGGPLCRQCTAALLVVREGGKKQRIEVCPPKCSSIHVGGKWYSADSTAPLARLLASSFHFENASHVRVDEASLDLGSSTIRGRATATVKGVDVSLDLEREVFVARVSCRCATGSLAPTMRAYSRSGRIPGRTGSFWRRHSRWWRKRSQRAQATPSSFISKVEWLPEGVDIYMGRKNDGQRAAAALRSRYVSTVRVSKRLAGYREGREFHRFTYSVRILDLSRGGQPLTWAGNTTSLVHLRLCSPPGEHRRLEGGTGCAAGVLHKAVGAEQRAAGEEARPRPGQEAG